MPRKPWWSRTWAIISAAVAVIGAVTGVIGVIPLLARDDTTLDSLQLSVEPVDTPLAATFAVPVGADWATFPTSSSVCDATQLAWLEANGVEVQDEFLVSVANAAHDGPMMSLKEFRGDGVAADERPSHVAVTCDQTGAGASNLRMATLDPASARTAVYTQANAALPDNPLVFNLAPGENGQFALSIRSSADFTGTVVFESAVGTESRTVELPIGTLELLGTAPVGLEVVDGGLSCQGDPECSVPEVLAALR